MNVIIAYRVNGGRPQFVMDDDGEVSVFGDQDQAIDYTLQNALFQSGQADYQVIVLDEI